MESLSLPLELRGMGKTGGLNNQFKAAKCHTVRRYAARRTCKMRRRFQSEDKCLHDVLQLTACGCDCIGWRDSTELMPISKGGAPFRSLGNYWYLQTTKCAIAIITDIVGRPLRNMADSNRQLYRTKKYLPPYPAQASDGHN